MSAVFFGGPGHPERGLRVLLEQRVEAVPAGGSIDWMTYYFRDEALADALVRARRRGVAVAVCVEGKPRHQGANDAVFGKLREGLGDGLRVVRHGLPGHLHTKLYCFSHPAPAALVGSFNPSGNDPDDPAVIADIGDQDRGHNLLVELSNPRLVAACVERVRAIRSGESPYGRLMAGKHASVRTEDCDLFFFPRLGANPLERELEGLGKGSIVRIAASHVRDRAFLRRLAKLVKRGASVTLLTHHTLRRSPEKALTYLREHGIAACRYQHPDALPMHDKYVLAASPNGNWSAFGSYNFKRRSRWLNQELLVISSDEAVWNALDGHWRETLAEPWCRG